ncbi:3-oxoacyl-ACP reductase [Neosynechococcus sphagnicola sy1]|uniref:3-oxoacyl-ACP reductase n=1 Tax=Neosynechococcus sphagnicola sy1 TaxID=1497020 RepID=A0A098TMT3_9CYAN|nr:SDR family oxidoreductase [Neosynechococcus sphagnicola]KGF73635.1 3-oxoacyl-ACP reductase [Neosynechococcus sphagnicola sy1]
MTATFSGKVSIITGGSSGIGRACAQLLLKQGSSVVLVDINAESLSQTVQELTAIADLDQVLSLQLSVCSEADMTALALKVMEHFGRIDHLVASAGILRKGNTLKPVHDTTLLDWNAVLQTNLTGTFLSNRAVLPVMMEQKHGDIINISSVSGRKGSAFDAPYCASKFGIIGFSESLAEEVASYGIRVQTILPDAVDTPLWNQNGSQSIRAPLALPPERVAELIVHLLALPRDAFMLNTIIAPFKGRRGGGKSRRVKDISS